MKPMGLERQKSIAVRPERSPAARQVFFHDLERERVVSGGHRCMRREDGRLADLLEGLVERRDRRIGGAYLSERALDEATGQLPPVERAVLEMRLGGAACPDIAANMNLPLRTVYKLLHSARNKLRRLIDPGPMGKEKTR